MTNLIQPSRIPSIILSSFCATTIFTSGCTLSVSSTPPEAPPPVEAQADVQPSNAVIETDVAPVEVDEFFFVGGYYYYWHPGYGRYVRLRGEPPLGHRISHLDRLPEKHPANRPNHAQKKKENGQ
jgi:hypothetical protein